MLALKQEEAEMDAFIADIIKKLPKARKQRAVGVLEGISLDCLSEDEKDDKNREEDSA